METGQHGNSCALTEGRLEIAHTFETFLLLDENILRKRDNLHNPTFSTVFDDGIVGERERLTISRSPPNLKLSATTSSENLRKV